MNGHTWGISLQVAYDALRWDADPFAYMIKQIGLFHMTCLSKTHIRLWKCGDARQDTQLSANSFQGGGKLSKL
eukprot:5032050-Amphidinium_carterae.1